MVYRRSSTNVRKAPARRRATRRSRVVSRPRRRRTTSTKKHRCPTELSPTAKFALAQLDPFEPRCLGAKIPDSNTMPSIANSDVDIVPFQQPASNGVFLGTAYLPGYYSSFCRSDESTTAITWPASFFTRRNYANVRDSLEAIRPVAHAIRMVSGLAPTTATGFVHIGLDVESRFSDLPTGTNPDFPTTIAQMSGLPFYKRVTLASLTQSPLTVINKWIDDSAFRYQDPREGPNLGDGSMTSGGKPQQNLNFYQSWATIIVIVEGAPSGVSPLSVEHLLLTEALPKKTAFVLGTQAAPNSPGLISAVSTMQSETDFAHTEAEQESYIQRGLNEISRGAAAAGEQVFESVAVPLLQRFGYAAGMTASAMAVNAMTGRGGIAGVNNNPARLAL